MKKENIRVEGRTGTWYEINRTKYNNEKVFTMESEQHGDMADWIVIDKNNKELNEDDSYEVLYG